MPIHVALGLVQDVAIPKNNLGEIMTIIHCFIVLVFCVIVCSQWFLIIKKRGGYECIMAFLVWSLAMAMH